MSMRRPILITGSHRSGSTWIGRMIATAPGILYIHEPFSVTDPPGPGVCNLDLKYWFTYINQENEKDYYHPVKNMLELRYDLSGALSGIRSKNDLFEVANEYREFRQHLGKGAIPVIKDPFTFFSSEWLGERFGMSVVIVIRHPAAFVSSILKLKWSHPFSHFLAQPLLMERILGPFKEEIWEFSEHEQDLIDQGILLWKIIHWTILKYQREHKDWIFIRHEDMARDPLPAFYELFRRLDLEFTEYTREVIEDYTCSNNPVDTDAPVGSEDILMRNSRSLVSQWKNRLSSAEIERIKSAVSDISQEFYSEEEW